MKETNRTVELEAGDFDVYSIQVPKEMRLRRVQKQYVEEALEKLHPLYRANCEKDVLWVQKDGRTEAVVTVVPRKLALSFVRKSLAQPRVYVPCMVANTVSGDQKRRVFRAYQRSRSTRVLLPVTGVAVCAVLFGAAFSGHAFAGTLTRGVAPEQYPLPVAEPLLTAGEEGVPAPGENGGESEPPVNVALSLGETLKTSGGNIVSLSLVPDTGTVTWTLNGLYPEEVLARCPETQDFEYRLENIAYTGGVCTTVLSGKFPAGGRPVEFPAANEAVPVFRSALIAGGGTPIAESLDPPAMGGSIPASAFKAFIKNLPSLPVARFDVSLSDGMALTSGAEVSVNVCFSDDSPLFFPVSFELVGELFGSENAENKNNLLALPAKGDTQSTGAKRNDETTRKGESRTKLPDGAVKMGSAKKEDGSEVVFYRLPDNRLVTYTGGEL